MDKSYKAVIVCTDPENGVLFARRADSVLETDHIIFDDIMRIMEDYDTKVTIENKMDGYGEWVTIVSYNVNDESTDMLEYKVCFDEPVDNSVDEPVDNRRNANEQAGCD